MKISPILGMIILTTAASAEVVPRGQPLDRLDIDLRQLGVAITLDDRPVNTLFVYEGGYISLGRQAPAWLDGDPGPLRASDPPIVAPLWSGFDREACGPSVDRNQIEAMVDEDGALVVGWINMDPVDCNRPETGSTFAVRLRPHDDGLTIELLYESVSPDVVEPRAGVVVGDTVIELLADDGKPRPARGTSLVATGSDGVPGLWTIELDNVGRLVGDRDGDGLRNADNCPVRFNPHQENLDGDEQGDVCDDEADGDGVLNRLDNCPLHPNPNQADADDDGIGDLCDDDDADGWPDVLDLCPHAADPANGDRDRDGLGDACEADPDDDDWLARKWGLGRVDRCPLVVDPLRGDADGDGLGDFCDLLPWCACDGDCRAQSDADADSIGDLFDVCPTVPDFDQNDADGDGLGDACDPDGNGDGILDLYQVCQWIDCGAADPVFGWPRPALY